MLQWANNPEIVAKKKMFYPIACRALLDAEYFIQFHVVFY